MFEPFLRIHLLATVPIVMNVLAVIALIALLASRRWRRWLPIAAVVIVAGAGFGFVLAWILGDLLDLFGVDLSFLTRVWFAVAVAGLSLGIARIVFSRRRGIIVGVAAGLVIVLAGGLGINVDLGEFVTVRDVFALADIAPLRALPHSTPVAIADWNAPAGMPKKGLIGSIRIPGTTSHFNARLALIYLPPAALVAHPARLPVLILMSGEPGGPSQLFASGGMTGVLDSYARAHAGLTPIIVVADQLGAVDHNPMCVDSKLGNAATYMMVDVPRWVRHNLIVLQDRANWGIGGFSEGGTCAVQFGAAHPELFGSIVDISGQIAPTIGTKSATIAAGFGGSVTKYNAALPATILKAHAPYADVLALFNYGELDARYAPQVRQSEADARAAGMQTKTFVSPGTAHDWHTVEYSLSKSIGYMSQHWGLGG